MVIGNLTGYASSGYGMPTTGNPRPSEVNQERLAVKERQPVTLDAQLDPKTPNEYSVAPSPSSLPPPERVSEGKSADRRNNQNSDPASRAFLAIANYQSRPHQIDLKV